MVAARKYSADEFFSAFKGLDLDLSAFRELNLDLSAFKGFNLNSSAFEELRAFGINSPVFEQIELISTHVNFYDDMFFSKKGYLEKTNVLLNAFENVNSYSEEITEIKFDKNFDINNINETDMNNLDILMGEISNLNTKIDNLSNKIASIDSTLASQYFVQYYLWVLSLIFAYLLKLSEIQ